MTSRDEVTGAAAGQWQLWRRASDALIACRRRAAPRCDLWPRRLRMTGVSTAATPRHASRHPATTRHAPRHPATTRHAPLATSHVPSPASPPPPPPSPPLRIPSLSVIPVFPALLLLGVALGRAALSPAPCPLQTWYVVASLCWSGLEAGGWRLEVGQGRVGRLALHLKQSNLNCKLAMTLVRRVYHTRSQPLTGNFVRIMAKFVRIMDTD